MRQQQALICILLMSVKMIDLSLAHSEPTPRLELSETDCMDPTQTEVNRYLINRATESWGDTVRKQKSVRGKK